MPLFSTTCGVRLPVIRSWSVRRLAWQITNHISLTRHWYPGISALSRWWEEFIKNKRILQHSGCPLWIRFSRHFHLVVVVLSQDSRHHLDMCHAYIAPNTPHHQYPHCQVLYSVHWSASPLYICWQISAFYSSVHTPTRLSSMDNWWLTNWQFAVFDGSMLDNRHLLVMATCPDANKVKWTMTRLRGTERERHSSQTVSDFNSVCLLTLFLTCPREVGSCWYLICICQMLRGVVYDQMVTWPIIRSAGGVRPWVATMKYIGIVMLPYPPSPDNRLNAASLE